MTRKTCTELLRLDSRVNGIPCQIAVTHYLHKPPYLGSPWFCDSDMDYYGWTEVDFEVLDRRGRPAAWLEKKLTDEDRERIEAEVHEHMQSDKDY